MCFVYKRDVHKSLLALNKNAVWGGETPVQTFAYITEHV